MSRQYRAWTPAGVSAYRLRMRPIRFRLTALIAAYAFALQTLLVAFAVVVPLGLAPHAAEICLGGASNDGKSVPSPHDVSCAVACAALGNAIAEPRQPVIAWSAPALILVLDATVAGHAPVPAFAGLPRVRAPPFA